MKCSAAVLDNDAITELIEMLNVMKTEKWPLPNAKSRETQNQETCSKIQKAGLIVGGAVAQARKINVVFFGDNDQYDDIDQIGEKYDMTFFNERVGRVP